MDVKIRHKMRHDKTMRFTPRFILTFKVSGHTYLCFSHILSGGSRNSLSLITRSHKAHRRSTAPFIAKGPQKPSLSKESPPRKRNMNAPKGCIAFKPPITLPRRCFGEKSAVSAVALPVAAENPTPIILA